MVGQFCSESKVEFPNGGVVGRSEIHNKISLLCSKLIKTFSRDG